MASAAQAFSYGWTQVPHSFFRYLPRVAKSGVRDVVGLVLDFTTGTKGRPAWTGPQYSGSREVTVQLAFARLLGVSKDTVSRDLIEAEALGLIRSRMVGRTKQYQAIPENFTAPPQTRNPRVLSIRKVASVTNTTHHSDVGTVETLETYRHHSDVGIVELEQTEGEKTPPSKKINSECFQEVGNRTPDNLPGYSGTEKSGSGHSSEPAERINDVANFSQFCLITITPKLASVPPKNIVTAAIQALSGAPIKMLESRIALKLPKIRAWGMIVLLANDVRAAWEALGVPIPNRSQYRLDDHWASAAEVRRLNADPATPAEVKREILLMWPELTAGRKTKEAERRESYERSFALARKLDEMHPSHLSHPNKKENL